MAYVPEIAKNLIENDPTLIDEWRGFYRSLGLGSSKLAQLEYRFRTATVEIVELFIEIINAWVSRLGNEATVTNLIQILKQESFIAASELLQKIYKQSISNYDDVIRINRHDQQFLPNGDDGTVASSSTTGTPLPLWYNIEKATSEFQGREEELVRISTIFKQKIGSGESVRVFISGSAGVGKTELAKRFTAGYHHEENSSCIWIDGRGGGAKLQRNFIKFVEHVLPPSSIPAVPTKISSVVSLLQGSISKETSWLFVFDGVDDEEGVVFVKSILKEFSKLPPVQDPFVLVTSRNEINSMSIKLDHWSEGNLKFLATHCHQVTSELEQDCLNGQENTVRRIGSGVASIFDKLDKDKDNNSPFSKRQGIKAAITLLCLVTHFVVDDIASSSFFKAIWRDLMALSLNKAETEVLLGKVLQIFNFSLGILMPNPNNNGSLVRPPPEVISIIQQMFIRSKHLRTYLSRALDLPDVREKSVLLKLMQVILRNQQGPNIYQISTRIDSNVTRVLQRVMSDAEMIVICKSGLCRFLANSNDIALLNETHVRFSAAFGISDDATLSILEALVQSLVLFKHIGAVDKLRELFDLKKAKYGPADDITYAAYKALLRCIIDSKTVGEIPLREEMIGHLEMAGGTAGSFNLKVCEEKYELAQALMKNGGDEKRGKKLLTDLSPICEKNHPTLYQDIRSHLDAPSPTKEKVVSYLLSDSPVKVTRQCYGILIWLVLVGVGAIVGGLVGGGVI